jgi:hypothetical protein
MNLLMENKPTYLEMSTMEYVRFKIASIFFRGDILGQAGRIKSKNSKLIAQSIADQISGDALAIEDRQRAAI